MFEHGHKWPGGCAHKKKRRLLELSAMLIGREHRKVGIPIGSCESI